MEIETAEAMAPSEAGSILASKPKTVRRSPRASKEEIAAYIHSYDNRGSMSGKKWAKANGVNLLNLHSWKRRFRNKPVEDVVEVKQMSSAKADEVKQTRIENQRLRMIVSDLMLERQALIEYNGGREWKKGK